MQNLKKVHAVRNTRDMLCRKFNEMKHVIFLFRKRTPHLPCSFSEKVDIILLLFYPISFNYSN